MRGVICVLLTIFCVSGAQNKTCPLPSSNLTLYASEDWQDLESPHYGVSNYDNNTFCKWTIRSQDVSKRIVLEVDSLDLETSPSGCAYDYIQISDGYDFNETYCRPGIPPITLWGVAVYVRFSTDSSNTKSGFHLRYRLINATDNTESSLSTQICRSGGVNLQAESAPKYITSVTYPQGYPRGTCIWTIRTLTANYLVKIVVEDSDLDSSDSSSYCIWDYLAAYDGSGTFDTQLDKWCGTTKPTIYSTGSSLTLKFRSNYSNRRRGFKLSYQEVPGNESSVFTQICRSDGMSLQTESYPKEIASVNYPRNYPPDTDCQWTIQTLTAYYVVKIVVEDSDLEISSSCSYDYLVAYDGSGTLATQLEKWCGTTKPTIYSSGSFLTLKFHSNYFSGGGGFKLSYQEVPEAESVMSIHTCRSGGMNLQAASSPKYISSLNYPQDYPINTDCQWTIQTLTANYVVKIVVEDSDLEYSSSCSWDYLVAYDGSGIWGTQLDKWCGTRKPTIYSSGSSLTLKFHSDGSGSGRGFKLSYQEVPESERVSGLSIGAIIGIVVGVLAGLILFCICCCCYCRSQTYDLAAPAGTAAAMTSRGLGGTVAGSQVFFTTSTFRPNIGRMTTNQYAAAYDPPPYPGPAQCSSPSASSPPKGFSYPQPYAPAGYPAQVTTSMAGNPYYNWQESLPSEPPPPYCMADQYEVQPAQQPTLDTSGAGGQSQPTSAAAASSTATVPAPGADMQQRAQGSAPPAAPRSGQAAPGGSDNRAFVPDEV